MVADPPVRRRHRTRALALTAALAAGLSAATAGEASLEWQLHTSVHTTHWDPEPEYVEQQHLLGLQATRPDGWLAGFAAFRNSWDQPSQYLFVGRRWTLGSEDRFFVKLTGGLLHGYDGEYQDRIPLNDLGVAPAILPSVGFQYEWLVLEAHLAALSAMTVTVGIRF